MFFQIVRFVSELIKLISHIVELNKQEKEQNEIKEENVEPVVIDKSLEQEKELDKQLDYLESVLRKDQEEYEKKLNVEKKKKKIPDEKVNEKLGELMKKLQE